MPNKTIQAAGEAMPEMSDIILGSVHADATHTLKASDLRKLPMEELEALMDLLVALDDLTCAFLNQPRYATGDPFNMAGELGDSIGTHLSACIALVEQSAMDAKPSTHKEAKHRSWLLLKRASHYADDLALFVSAAAQLSISVSEVEGA